MVAAHKWTLADIPFDQIEDERVRDNENLFFVLASASLVESEADIYTDVLLNYFDDSPVGHWLQENWVREETQHGHALRRYVQTVWPNFNWPRAYAGFCREYAPMCSLQALEPTPTLELAARCVVETGTAALYRALEEYTDEPVLKKLAGLIRRDEVRHYKYFHHYFTEYNRVSGYGRWPVAKALSRRLAEVRNEDADCALRHVFVERYPETSTDSLHFQRISQAARGLVMRNIAPDMMIKMLLQPLALPPLVRNSLQLPCAQAMRLFMLAS